MPEKKERKLRLAAKRKNGSQRNERIGYKIKELTSRKRKFGCKNGKLTSMKMENWLQKAEAVTKKSFFGMKICNQK